MRNFVTRVGILYLGRLVEIGPVQSLFGAPAHPYTRSLIAAVPVVSDEEAELKPNEPIVEGEIPSPANQPAGCAFHTRCPHAFAPCAKELPDPVQLDAGHFARCHLLAPGGSTRGRTNWRKPRKVGSAG